MKVICDIETDRLIDPTVVHCIVCIDVATLKVYKYRPWEMKEFVLFARDVTEWIGHNFQGFDARQLKRLLDVECTNITDTLILSRLEEPKRQGGHSLSNWGTIFKFPKGDFKAFGTYTPEMLEYCVQDCKITYYVWQYLTKKLEGYSTFCQTLEHQMQEILDRMKRNGFLFDMDGALELRDTLDTRYSELGRYIRDEFPPEIFETTFTPKVNRPDLGYKKGVPVLKKLVVPFNIKSPKQVVTRLNEAGWQPTERTKGANKAIMDHRFKRITKEVLDKKLELGWRVCEENLATIPVDAPESAKSIGEYLMLASRLTKLDESLKALEEDGRVHGTCISTGARTHRAAHYDPNMANQPGSDSPWGVEMRKLWTVPEGRVLLGVDASGIQLRILADLIGDPAYISEVCDGDIHEVHKEALGEVCKSRANSKTFFYAWILGAGTGKVASILGAPMKEAKGGMNNFYQRIPGLGTLKRETIPAWARAGWMYGLDGRRMAIPNEHLALASALQGNEKSIMAVASVLWHKEAARKKIDFKLVAFTHDDWETEVSCEPGMAEELGVLQINSLKRAGEILQMKCPLDGEAKIGKDWYDVH
jgi:DNA polymerase-1